jgi:NADH:ubiquinone oxidoreductase subunit 3 (subunit A)
MVNLPVSDNALKETITQHQSKLKTYINNIKTDKTNIERYNNSDYNTLDGQEITSNLVLNSNYLHYMMWIIIAIAILFLFLHATMSDSYNALTVIVGLLAIFLVSRWVYSSM